jgi:hypothetical protein
MNLKTLSVGCHGDRTVDAIVEIDPVTRIITSAKVGTRTWESYVVSVLGSMKHDRIKMAQHISQHCKLAQNKLQLTKNELQLLVRSQGPTVPSMKMTVFWNVAPCSVVNIDRRFRGAYCFHYQGNY